MTADRVEYWSARRERELDYRDGDPDVLVIGAGHSGWPSLLSSACWGCGRCWSTVRSGR